jgi:hypothetical protein
MMDRQTSIFIIVVVAVLFVLLLIIKNKRDRKRIFTPEDGTDPVSEKNTDQHIRRDKL